ncbi:nSTAND1 domain-containing NTPase [Arcticibacterium luteifluviistationis]|uniref:SHS2 domain-containing protein n=1 Tax=Arcticibacterium luteifluviistationis TaxID=1784714 RepID=A0A2Z4G6F1_9BACT|nr:cell division FtsA domain-containing protein [Arcticibacterium luteifluviistationis]AWV96724.1 hypothetical protein DJ013_00360 [Arcticibacterium luteifluviistationis]
MQKRYPFKYLDSYKSEDNDIFFGRESELERLYEMVFQADILLIYGASGSGKTSLIQCGLASKFGKHDWLPISIRRGNDINDSVEKALYALRGGKNEGLDWLEQDWSITELDSIHYKNESNLAKCFRAIYRKYFKPIYLVFDQFEELYTFGNTTEQYKFIETIKEILGLEQPVKVIICIQEEFLGLLDYFEKSIPELFQKKLRVEPLRLSKIRTILLGITSMDNGLIKLEAGFESAIAEMIFEKTKISNNSTEIDPRLLQVFFDKLYLSITGDLERRSDAELTRVKLMNMSSFHDVRKGFFKDRIEQIAQRLEKSPEDISATMNEMVDNGILDFTKNKEFYEIARNPLREQIAFSEKEENKSKKIENIRRNDFGKEETVYSIGLDIGNYKICAVAGRKDENGLITILDYSEEESFENKLNVIQAASRVLEELANKAGLDIGSVNCNISNGLMSLKQHKEEYSNGGNKFTISKSILMDLMKSANLNVPKASKEECLHVMPTDFFIDGVRINKYPEGATGNKLICHFNCVTIPETKLYVHYDVLNNLQYNVLGKKRTSYPNQVNVANMVYSSIADATAVLSMEDKKNGILLINLGAQFTEITVYKEFGLRYTHVLDFGTRAIIKDLISAFNITELRAEEVLRTCCDRSSKEIEINEVLELADKDGQVAKQLLLRSVVVVIECRIKEIVSIIASKAIESGYARVLGNGVMLSGAMAKLHLVKSIIEKSFNPLQVRITDSTLHIDNNRFLELSQPKYSTAIGLMLSSLKSLDERVPFTLDYKAKRKALFPNRFSSFLNSPDDSEYREWA